MKSSSPLSLIVAVDRRLGIGKLNSLPWHLPGDLRHFKETTSGGVVIMGRKTWDSIGRPLPGRTNIVVTRQPGWKADGAIGVPSLHAALEVAATKAPARVFVIGGAQIYAEALPLAHELIVTEVDTDVDADAVFPAFADQGFEVVSRSEPRQESGLSYCFVTYRRG